LLLATFAVFSLSFPFGAQADSGKEHGSSSTMPMGQSMGHMESGASVEELPPLKADLPSLLAEVERLRKEVARLDAIKPTFTNFMPEFSERFHLMHRAGDAGDWAVANHEAMELVRLLAVAQAIDPEKGRLLKSFMGESLERLDDAIAHGDKAAFDKYLTATVQNCNACHAAVGSSFIQVSLDVAPNMTMRHPHIFTQQHVTKHRHAN
jgi:hypothetical protein